MFHLVALSLAVLVTVTAQDAPPSTDIWLVAEGRAPVKVTDRDGYDNQPAFTRDGARLLYTSSRGGQTDIYAYDVESGRSRRLTETSESEYSPTPTPMAGSGFSVVRVEADSKQRLWAFDDTGKEARLLLEDVEPVGYHAWLDSDTLGLFVLGDPPTLQIARVAEGAASVVAENIGRSLHRTADGRLAYVDKSEKPWVVRTYDAASGETSRWVETKPGREDFALMPEGQVLMAEGAVIHRWTREGGWTPLHDFTSLGIESISRIAVSGDGSALAFVADR